MALRIATASVGLPLLLGAVWLGAPWFTIVIGLAAAVGAVELCALARGWGDRPVAPVAFGACIALAVGAHLYADTSLIPAPAPPVVAGLAGLSLVWLLWHSGPGRRPAVWTATAAVALYAGGLLAHAPVLREVDQGREWVYVLLAVTFAADTCAFVVGRAWGRRPMAPAVSPSKTWEGAVAAEVGAVGAAAAAVLGLGLDVPVVEALVLGAVLGVSGQIGDLFVSRLKRRAGAKDSGWVFPGHGGLLDRTDSIVFNLVVMYYFVS